MLESFAFPELRDLNTEKINNILLPQHNFILPSVKLFLG